MFLIPAIIHGSLIAIGVSGVACLALLKAKDNEDKNRGY